MSKVFMPEQSPSDRLIIMQQNADSIENRNYYRTLNDEELLVRKERLTDNSIKLHHLSIEQKELVAHIKTKMDPLKKENCFLINEIDTGKTEEQGQIFGMANHEQGMMEYFDSNGEMISSRRLTPEEKQGRVPFLKAVGE